MFNVYESYPALCPYLEKVETQAQEDYKEDGGGRRGVIGGHHHIWEIGRAQGNKQLNKGIVQGAEIAIVLQCRPRQFSFS